MIAKVAFCIDREKQDNLPAWQEEMNADQTVPPVQVSQFTSWEDFKF